MQCSEGKPSIWRTYRCPIMYFVTRSSDSLVLSILHVRPMPIIIWQKRLLCHWSTTSKFTLSRNSSSSPIFRSKLKTHLFKIAFPPYRLFPISSHLLWLSTRIFKAWLRSGIAQGSVLSSTQRMSRNLWNRSVLESISMPTTPSFTIHASRRMLQN